MQRRRQLRCGAVSDQKNCRSNNQAFFFSVVSDCPVDKPRQFPEENPMKILLVINACADECLRQAYQLTAFLRQNYIPEGDATAVGFGPAGREELLLECFRSLPVKKGILVRSADPRPEQILAWMEENLPRPDLCLFPGDGFGQEMAVRLAVRWRGSSLTGVTALDPLTGLAGRPFYAGHLEGRFRLLCTLSSILCSSCSFSFIVSSPSSIFATASFSCSYSLMSSVTVVL